LSSTAATTNGFSAIAPPASTSTVYDGLLSTSLVGTDESSIILPTKWRANTPLGIADEVAAVAFLRHFG
jgi:hypothetical protein